MDKANLNLPHEMFIQTKTIWRLLFTLIVFSSVFFLFTHATIKIVSNKTARESIFISVNSRSIGPEYVCKSRKKRSTLINAICFD